MACEHEIKAALLFGGQSPEHEISVQSASEVAEAMDQLEEVRPVPIYVTRAGKWHWGRPAKGLATRALVEAVEREGGLERHYEPAGLDFAQALLHLAVDEFATILIMIHGAGGEDGRLQGAFELAGLRHAGSGSAASALAMDKARCQAFLAARGLPVPRFLPLEAARQPEETLARQILEKIGLPCVVKPALCGSSVGLTIVRESAQLPAAFALAFKFSASALAESYIQGPEFTCGVLDMAGHPAALPITQIIPPEGRFFDYEAKYTPGLTRELTPAPIDPKLAGRIQELAVEAHRSVGCEGFSRVDFLADAEGPKIIEINTIPGMTRTSLLPQAAAAAGIPFPELVRKMIEGSLARRGSLTAA